jgi:hypothetical protein
MDTDLVAATPDPILTKALEEAEEHVQADWTHERVQAMRLHYQFQYVSKVIKHGSRALRDIAAEMYLSGAWAHVVIEIGESTLQFSSFPEWLRYATQESEMSSATESYINNYICFVLDPVAKGMITRPSGEPVEVEDVQSLNENYTMTLGVAARKTFMSSNPDLGNIGKLIEAAEDPTITRDDLHEIARDLGLKSRQIPRANAQIVELADRTVFIVTTAMDKQKSQVTSALDRYVEWHSAELEDVIEELRTQITEIDMPIERV